MVYLQDHLIESPGTFFVVGECDSWFYQGGRFIHFFGKEVSPGDLPDFDQVTKGLVQSLDGIIRKLFIQPYNKLVPNLAKRMICRVVRPDPGYRFLRRISYSVER